MKLSKIALAVIAATGVGSAFAQTTTVNLQNTTQTQDGNGNNQDARFGDASGAGTTTNVSANGFTQDQKGNGNYQSMWVGEALAGGSTNVVLGNAKQTQNANNSYQYSYIGYGFGAGGNSDVNVNGLTIDQQGSSNEQVMYMGVAENGAAKVVASDVHQTQDGTSNLQTASLGDNWGGSTGGSADLTLSSLYQIQHGSANYQSLSMGDAQYGGHSKVNATSTVQYQDATGSTQLASIGSVSGSSATSNVTTTGLGQYQIGATNTQELYMGGSWDGRSSNANDGGAAKVNASYVTQDQYGTNGKQYAAIGNAMGAASTTDVTIYGMGLYQGGTSNEQNVSIGNASNGGASHVYVYNLYQSQIGSNNHQNFSAGNAQ